MDPNAHNGMNNLHGGDDMNQNSYASLYGTGDATGQQHYGVYGQELGYGQMVNPTMPPRSISNDALPHFGAFDRMPGDNMHMPPGGLMPPPNINTYGLYGHPQQTHVGLGGMNLGSPPQSPSNYDVLSPPISGSDTSGNEGYHHSRNSSASSSRRNSIAGHRASLRYNPTPSPSGSERRSRDRSFSEEDDDIMGGGGEHIATQRKEATRKQRIEAEQKRRDELRDGYAKLKDVLPVSNAKSSKVSLLDRATKHISDLEREKDDLAARLATMEAEVRRLRALNEKISLAAGLAPSAAGDSPMMSGTRTPSGLSPMMKTRPLSPPNSTLVPVTGETPPGEHSDGSDHGF